MERRTDRHWAGRLGLAVAGLVLLLLTLEAGMRLAGVGPEVYGQRVDMVIPPENGGAWTGRRLFGYIPHAVVRSVYPSDPRGYFGPECAVDHRFNAAGWRDRERTERKSPGTFRILALGDSYLYGQGVRQEDTFLSLIEGSRHGGAVTRVVEAINTGMSAFNTAMERDLLAARGLAYRPDLVLLCFVPNDVEQDVLKEGEKVEFFREYTDTYLRPDRLSGVSRLWGWTRQAFLRHVRARAYLREGLDRFLRDAARWRPCRDALRDIAGMCRDRDIAFGVVLFPFLQNPGGRYLWAPVHALVREECDALGVPCLDLCETFGGFRGPELWVHPVDPHPNEVAHRMAAAAIVEWLRAERLAPVRAVGGGEGA